MDNNLSKYTVSFGLSFALASVINALLVVAKEKSHAVQNWMQNLTGHHWVTHSAIILVLFIGLGFLFSLLNGGQGLKLSTPSLIKIIIAGVAVSYAIITGFYLIAD
jgi:hypothetical protein